TVQAHLPSRGREALDPHAPVNFLLFAELLAPFLACLLHEAVHGSQEQDTALDMENHTQVGALAQIEVVASDGHTADQGRPQRLAQDAASQTELLLVAAFEAEIAAMDLVGSDEAGAPSLAQLAEVDELADAIEGDVIVVVRAQFGERFGRGSLTFHHLLPRMLRDVDALEIADAVHALAALGRVGVEPASQGQRLGEGRGAGGHLVQAKWSLP